MANYLVIGRGYTGRVLDRQLRERGDSVAFTSRTQDDAIVFNLEDRPTWANLPAQIDGTFITLAFKEPQISREFAEKMFSQLGRVVFMGTTSAFKVKEQHEIIDENSELDPSNIRNQVESILLENGAIGVHSAGIYGPDRSPLNWIQDGRVTASDRYVNFIHVEDLSQILIQAMLHGKPGNRYIASDGNPMRWSDIIGRLQDMYQIKPHDPKPAKRTSKRIDSTSTRDSLKVQLQYVDVIQGIQSFHP